MLNGRVPAIKKGGSSSSLNLHVRSMDENRRRERGWNGKKRSTRKTEESEIDSIRRFSFFLPSSERKKILARIIAR